MNEQSKRDKVNEALRRASTPKMVLETPVKRSPEHEALNRFIRRGRDEKSE